MQPSLSPGALPGPSYGQVLFWSAMAGLVSALMSGNLVALPLVFYIAPAFASMPLFAVGFRVHPLAAFLAALVALILLLGPFFFSAQPLKPALGGLITLAFCLLHAVPAIGLSTLIWYLFRSAPARAYADKPGEKMGMTVIALLAYFTLLCTLAVLLLQAELFAALEQLAKIVQKDNPDFYLPKAPHATVEEDTLLLARIILPLMTAFLFFCTLVAAMFGHKIANSARNSAIRLPDYRLFALPQGALMLTGLTALAMTIGQGAVEFMGAAAFAMLSLVWALQGLAVLHALSADWRTRTIGLALIWGLLFLFLPLVLVPALLGVADHLFRFRDKQTPQSRF